VALSPPLTAAPGLSRSPPDAALEPRNCRQRCAVSAAAFRGAVVWFLASAGQKTAARPWVAGDGLVLGLAGAQQGSSPPWCWRNWTLLWAFAWRQAGPWRPLWLTAEAPCQAWASACWCPLPLVTPPCLVEGRPFWTASPSLNHNLQRFSSVVKPTTCSPWWYFLCR